jgi:uncharacterized protein (TIGR00369 family)
MTTLGAELLSVTPGEVVIGADVHPGLTQQHGYVHAGVTMTLLDNACGWAAMSLAEPGREVLSVEVKVNLLAPGRGVRVRAHGRVVRSGRTLTVCQGDAYAVTAEGTETHIATVLATMFNAGA